MELEGDLNGEHMAKCTDNHNSGYLGMVVQHCTSLYLDSEAVYCQN